jgi:hypothetical protein
MYVAEELFSKHSTRCIRNPKRTTSRDDRYEQALCEELGGESAPRHSQRQSYANLPLSPQRAHEQKTGDVAQRHQEDHQRYAAEPRRYREISLIVAAEAE